MKTNKIIIFTFILLILIFSFSFYLLFQNAITNEIPLTNEIVKEKPLTNEIIKEKNGFDLLFVKKELNTEIINLLEGTN